MTPAPKTKRQIEQEANDELFGDDPDFAEALGIKLSKKRKPKGAAKAPPAPRPLDRAECTCRYHSGNQVDETGCLRHDIHVIIGRIMTPCLAVY